MSGNFTFTQRSNALGPRKIQAMVVGSLTNGNYDAENLQIHNVVDPTDDDMAVNKGFMDSAIGLVDPLTTKGDIFTYDTANARLPIGLDHQLLVANSLADTGLAWKTDLVSLGDHSHTAGKTINVDNVNSVGAILTLVNKVLMSTNGTRTIVQFGDVTGGADTNNVELNLEAKKDVSILIQSDTNKAGANDQIEICHTINGNEQASCTCIEKSSDTHTLNLGIESGSGQNQLKYEINVNKTYPLTTGMPIMTGGTTALSIDSTAVVTVPIQVTTPVLQVSNVATISSVIRSYTSASSTTTLTAAQVFSGYIKANPGVADTYTFPTAEDLVANNANPQKDDRITLVIANYDSVDDVAIASNTGLTFYGAGLIDVQADQAVIYDLIFTAVIVGFEAVDVYVR